MSGGVDSSVAAAVLKDQGFDVIGITAVMTEGPSRCCSPEDVLAAAAVAERLGISHHIIELHEEFSSAVIEYFISDYVAGRTPSPCVKCNRLIKFGVLADHARRLGAEVMATGHYVRTLNDGGTCRLLRGVDCSKDQSYFLSRLTNEQLAMALFPLGKMLKKDVLEMAGTLDFACRNSKESQELCFVPDGGHGTWIEVRSMDTRGVGDIVDVNGNKVGEHKGIHHYTIGQRRGLAVAMGKPVYVMAIDSVRNIVVVGERNEVLKKTMFVDDVCWHGGEALSFPLRARTQIRYNHSPVEGILYALSADRLKVEFDESQFAVTPGQLAVFYEGDMVLGAGWIVGEDY